jgi:very-short-patch-repair endonuclease
MITYDTKTKVELVTLCKERGIKGYASNNSSKQKIIDLLNNNDNKDINMNNVYDDMNYEQLLKLCKERRISGHCCRSSTGTVKLTKEKMINLLKENKCKKTLFDHLEQNNPIVLTKFVGNQDILKTLLPGTNKYYTWKCDTIDCSNTFEAIPINVYKDDSPRKYCDACSLVNQKKNKQISILKRSGSLESKFVFIANIWSNDNIKTPDSFSPGSNEKVKLKCPNISSKHPDYEIQIYHIQEHNQFRCPKCVTKSSNAEMRIYSELKQTFKDVRWQQKIEGREADVTIEDIKLVIEIDGFPWHKDKSEKDLEKNKIFEKNGYSVLRIRDPRLEDILCDTIVCNLTELAISDFNNIIVWINHKFKWNTLQYDQWKNIEYYKEIQASKLSINYEESIEYLFPESKNIWDYEKNHPFIPSQLSQGSCMQIWVKCCNGHSWKRKLSHLFRTINNNKHIMNCPECNIPKSNKTIIQINGKTYNSISECCRDLDIDRNILYKKKGTKDIQTTINELLKDKISVYNVH